MQRPWHAVSTLCRNLEVSKAGYYAWRQRQPSDHDRTDETLTHLITRIHYTSRRRYGAPCIHGELRDGGIRVGRKRVARLMKSQGLRAKAPPRRRVTTTDSKHHYPVAANLLNRRFTQPAPNRAWVCDITYFATKERWLYLAMVMDLFSRRIVGWSMSVSIDAALVLKALDMAVAARRPKPGLIVHSDRGSQYACREYRTYLSEHGLIASMSRKRNCWDNAVAERFFASIKGDLKNDRVWETHQEARSAIFEYIESWYNRQRRHSTLGYISPVAFEERHGVH